MTHFPPSAREKKKEKKRVSGNTSVLWRRGAAHLFVIARNSPSLMGTEPGPIKAISADENLPKNEYKATGPLYGQLCLYSIVSNSPRAGGSPCRDSFIWHDALR